MTIRHDLVEGSVIFATNPLTGKSVLARVVKVYGDMLCCTYLNSVHQGTFEIHISYVKMIEPKVITALRNLISK